MSSDVDNAPAAADHQNTPYQINVLLHRQTLLEHLCSSLDFLVFAEIATLYHIDNSTALLTLRVIAQIYLTKQDSTGSTDSPLGPYLGWIFGTNLLCSVIHILALPSSAGEATRGYLHGHFFIDFVGQYGPSSKIHLLALDGLILILQLALLSVALESKMLESRENRMQQYPQAFESAQTQTLDTEERGLLEDDPIGEELNPFVQWESRSDRARRQGDGLYSGQILLGTFWLFDIAKWRRGKHGRQIFTGPSLTLSSAISRDMRQDRGRYTLNTPFRG